VAYLRRSFIAKEKLNETWTRKPGCR